MQSKRGQLTIIIVIAVIIIALALLAFFLWPKISSLFMNEEQAAKFLASQAEPLRQSVADCIQESSLEGFEKISSQAGYYTSLGLKQINYLETNFIVVLFKDSAKQRINKLPSQEQISLQFQEFLNKEGNAKIDSCLNNLNSFKRIMSIQTGARTITPVFYDESIILIVNWPMKISKGKSEQNINQKDVELLIPLGNLHKVASDIIDCDVQINCKFTGQNWDVYTWNNPYTLRYINKQALNIDATKRVFIIESIPHRTGEKQFKFSFAEDLT